MKLFINIISLLFVVYINAQDLKTPDLNSINMNNWMNTPHVEGRYATLEDVNKKRAIYRSDGNEQKYIPIDLDIPFLALLEDAVTGYHDTVVVIQADKFKDRISIGYKRFHSGGYGAASLEDLIIIDVNKLNTSSKFNVEDVKTNLKSQNDLSKEKIEIIIPNCGIDSQWHRLKHNLKGEYWAIYEQVYNDFRGNFLIKKYNPNRPTIPDFLVKGMILKDSLYTDGKWIDKMLFLGESIRFSITNKEEKSKNYYIYAKGKLIETENNMFPFFDKIENYELIVESLEDKVRQTIRKMDILSFSSGGFEGEVKLYWIGDLNGDNLLDMLVGISQHYAGTTLSLFLSDTTSKQLFKEYIVGSCSYD